MVKGWLAFSCGFGSFVSSPLVQCVFDTFNLNIYELERGKAVFCVTLRSLSRSFILVHFMSKTGLVSHYKTLIYCLSLPWIMIDGVAGSLTVFGAFALVTFSVAGAVWCPLLWACQNEWKQTYYLSDISLESVHIQKLKLVPLLFFSIFFLCMIRRHYQNTII